MHPNPVFRQTQTERACAFARDRGFGVLTSAGPDGLLISHIPFVLGGTTDGSTCVDGHIVRSNPFARALRHGPRAAVLIISGPDSYVSPDWYVDDDQVPTWNYVAVHMTGQLEARPAEELEPQLAALSAANERRLAPKKPWTMDKNKPETLERLMRSLVPVRLQVTGVESTFKLNQNKSDDSRNAAAEQIEAGGLGHDTALLAALMRDPDLPFRE